ncbi:hypothetical protein [Streptomyces sp. NPDC012510]|uniref:hypothetical protein n=1 Tax=Streptomyces sp. NPDC012510 TaxID=3364838 RepID=UPI0036E9528A
MAERRRPDTGRLQNPAALAGPRPSLVEPQMYAEYTPNLTFVHEKANVGNPLNEAADSLAKPGLRSERQGAGDRDPPAGPALGEWSAGRGRVPAGPQTDTT